MRSRALAAVLLFAVPAGCGGDHAAPAQVERHFRADPSAPPRALAATARIIGRRMQAQHIAGTARVDGDELVVRVPAASRSAVAGLTARGRLSFIDWEPHLHADGLSHSAAVRRAAALPAGTLVVRDEAPARTYAVLDDAPALTGGGLTHVRAGTELGQPAVSYELTREGRAAMRRLTGTLARRGAARGSLQHFALVLDDQVLSLPEFDPHLNRSAVTAGDIEGGFTMREARDLAALLRSGPLPVARLIPVAGP